MKLLLQKSVIRPSSSIAITGSKSETNRLLLLQALYPNITVQNTSDSDDSDVMKGAFSKETPLADLREIDIHHAGTAMRFLTAYWAIQHGREVRLTGSSRMQERPIQILVDALIQLGADISYATNPGFPPLMIKGKTLTKNKVTLPADVSSQYISALLLIAPKLENGLELTLEGEITSVPYIEMTLGLLRQIGIQASFAGNTIVVSPKPTVANQQLTIESDWSSASYYYSIIALSEIGARITLSSYKKRSLQGDSILAKIYTDFGVVTTFENNSITLKKTAMPASDFLNYNLNGAPDMAQTIAVTCFGLGLGCCLTGLHTLKIKETDRLQALQNELTKLGARVQVTGESLTMEPASGIISDVAIKTYQDHRMAMAFAPLALKVPIVIEDAEVVSKSYPTFWRDLKHIGFSISEIE